MRCTIEQQGEVTGGWGGLEQQGEGTGLGQQGEVTGLGEVD